jgi:hypothetical protein
LSICKKERCKVVPCLINYAPRHEDVFGSRGIASPFFASALDVTGPLHAPAALSPSLRAAVLLVLQAGSAPGAGLDAVEYSPFSPPIHVA